MPKFSKVSKDNIIKEDNTNNEVGKYVLEIQDLCNMLNIGKNTAYGLLTSGELDGFKIGSVWKIPMSSFNEYLERKRKENKPRVQMYELINKHI